MGLTPRRYVLDLLGIDRANRRVDATRQITTGAQHYQAFPNTPDGFRQLQDWLAQHGVTQVHAGLEATNGSGEALATFLHGPGHTVSVVNPARIKGYALATMQRNTTDKRASAIIAAFCATHHPDAGQPLTAAHRRLRALVRHRDDLLQARLPQQNRLRATSDVVVRASRDAIREASATQRTPIAPQIRAHLAAHAELRTNLNLLPTIVGISLVTAAKLLAECAAIDQDESATLCANMR
jgi:transposase